MAEAQALVGEERECKLVLERARLHFQKIISDDPCHGRFGSGKEEWIDEFAGNCHLHLGDAKNAEVTLRKSADNFGVDDKKHKAETPGVWT